ARTEAVEGDKSEAIAGKKNETVRGNRSFEIRGDFTETIGKERSLKVGKNVDVTVDGKHTHKVKKTYALSAKEIQLVAEDQMSLKVGKASIVMKKDGDVVIKGGKIEFTG